jgi:hypothetical protein
MVIIIRVGSVCEEMDKFDGALAEFGTRGPGVETDSRAVAPTGRGRLLYLDCFRVCHACCK